MSEVDKLRKRVRDLEIAVGLLLADRTKLARCQNLYALAESDQLEAMTLIWARNAEERK